MIVKAALTAIDHNINVERLQALTQKGVPRFKLETDRGGTKWFIKVVKAPKDTDWKDEIVSFVLRVLIWLILCQNVFCFKFQCVETDCRPDVRIPVGNVPRPKNQAHVERPTKSEAVLKHQKRFMT
jgi:hypothetical protein